MRSVVTTAKTVEEAVDLALTELNCSLEDVDIQILEEAKSGLFGLIGSKDAVVRVSVKEMEDTIWEASEAETFVNDLDAAKREVYASKETQTGDTYEKEEIRIEEDFEETAEESLLVDDAADDLYEEEAVETADLLDEEALLEDEDDTRVEQAAHKSSLAADVDPDEIDYSDDVEEDDDLETEEVDYEETKEETTETTPVADAQKSERTSSERSSHKRSSERAPKEGAHLTDEEVVEKTENYLNDILSMMHIEADVEARVEEENLHVEIVEISDEDMGIVIGRRAETLNALQYLLSVAINRDLDRFLRVFLDVGGYRERRKASIEKMAMRNAEKVKKFKRPIALEPMNAYERRIVHFALQDVPRITTVSEGRDPYRKVVIKFEK